MKIIELKTENIKRIKAVEIKPDSNMVIVAGKNAQGKTSVLDSIAMALGGKKEIPENPVRNGEETAEIILSSENYKITRNWTKTGNTYLKVTNSEGAQISNAQSFLDGLIGNLSFDPMAFCNKAAKERVKILKDVMGVDFSDLESKYRETYDERTFVNRQLRDAEGELKSFDGVEDVEVEDISEIQAERENAVRQNDQLREKQNELRELKASLFKKEREVVEIEDGIEKLRARLSLLGDCIKKDKEKIESMRDIETCGGINLTPFDQKIASHSERAAEKQRYQQKLAAQDKVTEKKQQSEKMTKELADIEKEKQARLEAANMPIEGLDFLNGDVSFEGVEFDQISSAQKIKVSMAIAMAMNPKIKIIRIMNGSLLDDDAMKEIEVIANEKDFQVWIEKVANTKDGNAIYIEDGALA